MYRRYHAWVQKDEWLTINAIQAVDAAWRAEGISTMDPDDLANTFNTNVISTHLTTVGFLPLLKKGNCKKVINM